MKTPRKNVSGTFVRKVRYQKKLSQAALARKCQLQGWDISRDIIAKIELGIRWVSDSELLNLARALEVSPLALLPKNSA